MLHWFNKGKVGFQIRWLQIMVVPYVDRMDHMFLNQVEDTIKNQYLLILIVSEFEWHCFFLQTPFFFHRPPDLCPIF